MAGIIKDGQVYAGVVTDDHIKEVIKSNIATTLDSSCTNEQVAGAKDVYDKAIKDKNLKTYTSLSQLGLTEGSETLSDIATNMSNNSMAILNVQSSCNVSEYPVGYGVLTVNKLNINRVSFIFTETGGASTLRQWFASYNGGKLNGWKRVCTTSVADVSLTNVTDTIITSNATGGTLKYFVKNGKCYVELENIKIASNSSGGLLSTFNFPIPYLNKKTGYKTIQSWGDNKTLLVVITENGGLAYWCSTDSMGSVFNGSFSYLVAES